MKVIEASVREIQQAPGINAIYQHIERCGRTCYKSEDKITEDSAMKFFQSLVSRKHYAMLEHGTVYFRFPYQPNEEAMEAIAKVVGSKYSFTRIGEDMNAYCTTNMRVLIEEVPNVMDSLLDEYALEEPDANHIKRVTAHFVISRGIANEFVRHRVFSFAQESTRFCNYGKDKFGAQLTFIIPEWLKGDGIDEEAEEVWIKAMSQSEKNYLDLIKLGVKPQNARGVLDTDLKTELVMTGTIDQWMDDFFEQRYYEATGPAHPDAKAIAKVWFNILWDNENKCGGRMDGESPEGL